MNGPVEVAENLWCGGHPGRPLPSNVFFYPVKDFDVIVNLSFLESVRPNQKQLVIWSPIRDNSELPPTIPMLWTCISAMLSHNRKVLVHCDQGLNRAPFLAACVITKWWGMDGEETVELLRAQVPGCLTNPVFVNYLRPVKV